MHFQLTDDQRALKAGVRALLAGRFGREALRAAADRPGVLDRALWRELGEAGFFALRLPEAEGGVGLGLPEAVLAFEEAGRALLPGPLVATHLAAGEVAGAATGETVVTAASGGLVEWLTEADVVRGDATGAVPLVSVDPLTPLHRLPRSPEASPDVFPDASAGVSPGISAGVLPGVSPGGSAGVSPSTSAGALPGGSAGVSPGASADDEPDPVAVLLTAAEQLGGAARTCELAVEYARTRKQFGQPIGAFQAVKHLCAQSLVRVETARAAVYAAAVTVDPLDIAAARLLADDAALRGARDCLQVHGGMGFTWEAETHLFLKRAWVRTQRMSSNTYSDELLAADLLSGVG
ncbi:acyl-CoA dehydrogenase family protein [Streptomyces yaanensis]|uniref:Acyl-CoA dehydrogenase family protein n=1 Tax=Streptomyces yaanensis TaxID=1142239 RepID=A0ABV7S9W6_9ACTN|nr:acyl-CoA dehydrogenase family protein [Streptomyces sp. CGMCC 4.7035]WNC02538.1 acyl-CoA dehydrogenase family protein [Streptomyces sp. CGMCC 4.7035]